MSHPRGAWALLLAAAWPLLTAAAVPAQTSGSQGVEVGPLRDITGIEQEPPAPAQAWRPLGLVAAGAVAAGTALLCWTYWRRRRPEAAPRPGLRALAELEQLDALGLAAAGQVERYHTLLADIIRRYLEGGFQLRATQQSTDEFLEAMRRAPQLTADHQGLLRDFLRQCDLAKFARAGFSTDQCRAAARMARVFVEQTAGQQTSLDGKPASAPQAAGPARQDAERPPAKSSLKSG